MRAGAPQRIAPALGLLEIDAGNTQRVDRHLLARAELAGEVDELLFGVRQALGDLGFIQFRQYLLELARGFRRVDHFLRVGIQRDGGQRDSQKFAVAVGYHGALGAHRGVRGFLRFQQFGDRAFRAVRHQRLDHGGVGQLQRDGEEQHGEAGGGKDQPPAGFFERGAAVQVGRGDAHVFHHRHGAAAWRAGTLSRQAARR